MKQRLKGLLALVLSLVMVFALATNAWAAVWIGNVELNQGNSYSVKGANGQGTATYDSATNTLTLNNFTIVDNSHYEAISSDQDLTLNLIGENKITASYPGSGGVVVAVSVTGKLAIEGTGSLNADGTYSGLSASRGVDISGGTVTAEGDVHGIISSTGNVSITGGEVEATGRNSGINANNITISGGEVEAKATNNTIGVGIKAIDSITIGGNVNKNPEVNVGCATGLKADTVNILENSTVNIDTNALPPTDGKTIDCTTLTFGSNWYQWSKEKNKDFTTTSLDSSIAKGTAKLYIKPITYTVTYADGGGVGTDPTQTSTAAGGTFTLAQNPYTKSGYTFAGWNDGANTYAAGATYTMPANDVILTAQWTENSTGGPGSYWSGPNTISPDDSDKSATKTESPNTFDGGIASAVVVTILSATGGAWLAKKKD